MFSFFQTSCINYAVPCYCPDIGPCELFSYSIDMNKLVGNNRNIGNHNRNYYFTVKVTNNALLSNIEHIDILVDDSPPEIGVVFEGAFFSIISATIKTHHNDYYHSNVIWCSVSRRVDIPRPQNHTRRLHRV